MFGLLDLPDEWNRFLGYRQIDAVLKLSEDANYCALPAQVNQQAIRKTCKSWTAYFAAKRKYAKDPTGFTGKPKWPGYIKEDGSTAHFTKQVAKISTDDKGVSKLTFPCSGGMSVTIGKGIKADNYVKCEVKPSYGGYYLFVTYMEEDAGAPRLDAGRMMGGDPGLGNFVTCLCNFPVPMLVIRGGRIRSINQGFNKEKAFLTSELTKGHVTKKKRV